MYIGMGPEGVQGATGKPPGRLRRGETLHKTEKARKHLSLASHKKPVSCGRFRPPAGGRGTFPHGKVPKGCRGRPKGACLMAAPGPPVAKEQCTASLAGARPAGFTSVPGRATVAFGAADPSPGVWAPVYPWSDGQGLPRPGYLGRRLAAASRLGKARARRGATGSGGGCVFPFAHALQGQISPHPGGSIFLPGTPFPPGNSPVFPFTNGGFSATMKRSALEPCARAADHSDGVLGGRR